MTIAARATLIVLACLVALLALWVRAENAIGIVRDVGPVAGQAWGSYDPDTLYHARRVERGVRDRGWIASHDPLLDHPHPPGAEGAPIPWPPYYDLLLTAVVRGALPEPAALFERDAEARPEVAIDEVGRARIEQIVATVPMVCGALAALLAALFAGGLARRLASEENRFAVASGAALAAGLSVTLAFGHVRYSHLGNGDHHAFVSLLHVLLLGLVGRALAPDRIVRPLGSAVRGAIAGIVAGVLVASWTASILWVALVEVALALRLVLPFRASAQGLPLFATSFHKTAILVLVPAVIESPYTSSAPFSVVDLSWFHLVWLAAWWLVFAPYALVPRLATRRPIAATVPSIGLLGLVLVATDAPSRAIEALSWAGATNAFMGSITESQPLVGEGGSLRDLVKWCGIGVVLLPIAWALAVRWTRRVPELLPWVVTLPVLLAFACLQRRFAEPLTAPLAVVLGVVVSAALVGRVRRSGAAQFAAVCGVAVLALAAHPWTLRNTLQRVEHRRDTGERFVRSTPTAQGQGVIAELLAGLAPEREGARGVLAEWDLGHAIEWRAQRPTIATNFGLYLGDDSFLAPWRYFTATDEGVARDLLDARDVSHVLIDARTFRRRRAIADALGDEAVAGAGWDATMAARLAGAGIGSPEPPPGDMRLVRLASDPLGGTIRVYEVVGGARLRATARSISAVVTVAGEAGTAATWRTTVSAAGEGPEPLELSIPYAPTEDERATRPFGGVVVRSIEVFVDGQRVSVAWTESDVRAAASIDIG